MPRCAGAAVGVERHRVGCAALGDPCAEEMMLQQRDPAAAAVARERTIVDEIRERTALVTALAAPPRRAAQAEGFRIGDAALYVRRHADQLPVHEALPRLVAGVDRGVLHFDRTAAAGENVIATDTDAVRAAPDERHYQLL